jgi:hypothetical protein
MPVSLSPEVIVTRLCSVPAACWIKHAAPTSACQRSGLHPGHSCGMTARLWAGLLEGVGLESLGERFQDARLQ